MVKIEYVKGLELKYDLMKNKDFYRFIVLLIVFCFFNLPLNQNISASFSQNYSDSDSYGFIVSLINHTNESYENRVNCKIRHMINDFLRDDIPVYWTAENITVNVKRMIDAGISDEENKIFFERGSFIIPFTGDEGKDSKVSVVVYDYNESSEIGRSGVLKIPVYVLIGQLETNAFLLTEVKIAQVVNIWSTEEWEYVKISGDCGFLTYENIEEKDLYKNLKNSDYNTIIWPGGVPSPFITGAIYSVKAELKRNSGSTAIRDFVNNGGGFVGSCYGAFVASYCALPLPAIFKRRAYNHNLRSFGLLAISDVVVRFTGPDLVRETKILITNNSHPVTYGLDPMLISWFCHGPKFLKIGRNSEVVGAYYKSGLVLSGSPSWVSSKFGDGRVILFGSHPEIYATDLDGDDIKNDIISNALYYTTFRRNIVFKTNESRELSFILESWDKTNDLSDYLVKKESIFDEVRIKINESLELSKSLWFDSNESLIHFYYEYLKDSLELLTFIEMIYHLFEDDSDFETNLTIFKDELFHKVNTTISKFKYCIRYFDVLAVNPPKAPGIIIKYLIFRKIIRHVSYNYRECYREIPGIYFDAQKFLRQYWYQFETDIAIQQ